jgi:hypothetical protein
MGQNRFQEDMSATTGMTMPGQTGINDVGAQNCRTAQILVIFVATVLHAIFLGNARPLQSANDRSRWCTVWSLVERGTFQIDEIRQRPGWDTIDLVHVDGHFYSTKPPLLTAIVAGITWFVQRVTGWTLTNHLQGVTLIVLSLVNLVPLVVSLGFWVAILDRIAVQNWTRLFAVVVAAFGTLLTPFLMTLNNHTVAAAAVMIALYALQRILDDGDRQASWPFALCGMATAWGAVNELPAASFGAIALALAAGRSMRKTWAIFLPAAAIPVIALVAANVIATGSWKPIYADYGSDKYRFIIDGVPSYWMHPQGVDRNLDRPWMYFIHCTIGHHGILSLTPVWALAIIGWLTSFQLRDRALRTLMWLGAATSVIVIAFYLTRTQNYNYGGVSCGLRWALWLIPLWLVAIVPVLDQCAGSRTLRGVAMVLTAISMYSAWQPIESPWRQPWLFQWMEARGWIDYTEPAPELPKPLWTWFASLPDTTVLAGPAWIEFTVARPGLTARIVRLTARSDTNSRPGERVELEVRETTRDDDRALRIRKLLIDVPQFNAGAPPADFLRWANPEVTAAQQQADLAFVRGLPRKIEFAARAVRYLKTSLRREALRCQQAAAHVAFSETEIDKPLTYRCDAWLSPEVPFGVAQVEFHVSSADNTATLFHERWTVHDCWPKVLPFEKP